MDSKTLQRSLIYLVGHIADVYTLARDYVGKIRYQGKYLIVACNTGNSHTGGLHWCIFITYKSGPHIVTEYYDSYAETAQSNNINYPYPITRYNNIVHQNYNSTVCGQLCIYFVYLRFLPRGMTKPVVRLGRNKNRNEQVACDFFDRLNKRIKGDELINYTCKYFGCFPKNESGW